MKHFVLLAFALTPFLLGLPATSGGAADVLEPTNLTALNTKADEEDPFISPDALELRYATNAAGSFDLMLAKRYATTQKWPAGKPLSAFNTKDADERSPFVTRDKRVYYATNQVPDEKFKDLKNFDIWESVGERAPLPLLQVSTAEDEMFPWATPSGKEFYFSRKTKEGWRVFLCKGPFYGAVGEGKLIEELPAGFHHTTLSTNGLTMYLQGPLEKERWGLFRSTRAKLDGGVWTKPEPLTALNNPDAPRGDMSPCLSADGATLYFVSDRPGGQGGLDLWSIPTAKLIAKTK